MYQSCFTVTVWLLNGMLMLVYRRTFFIYRHDLQFINFVDSMLLLCLDPMGSVSRGQRYQGLNLCLAVGILFELFLWITSLTGHFITAWDN